MIRTWTVASVVVGGLFVAFRGRGYGMLWLRRIELRVVEDLFLLK
jgi:hypothetical protein